MNFPRSAKLKSQLLKVFWITVGWTIISIFKFLGVYVAVLELNCDLRGMSPLTPFFGSILVGVLAGVLGGSGVVFLWERWLRTMDYGWTLISIFLSYSVIYLMVAIPSNLYYQIHRFGGALTASDVWLEALAQVFNVSSIESYLFWLFIVLGTLIVLLVNDKYGPGVFRAFLLGKYFHPKREERIFMFLDLRSSTTIAEKLGEERYFNFLKDVFGHSTPSILNDKGEIYQYVGDEIVISWKTDTGVHNANCIRCFFDIQRALKQKGSYYLATYGIEPEFKAGLHYGHVMAGEIGVVKRDIAFSGDVLNTTSRIQSKCNELGVNILLSKFLVDKLGLQKTSFNLKEIGNMDLRGKEHSVALFTV